MRLSCWFSERRGAANTYGSKLSRKLSTLFAAAALLAAGNVTRSSELPTVSQTRQVELAGARWSSTAGLRQAPGSGEWRFVYVGTGAQGGYERATLIVSVTPGNVYIFTIHADPTYITGRPFDVLIDKSDASVTYAGASFPAGTPGAFSTPPWQCPPGITSVQLGVQLWHVTVTKGKFLTFSDPRLTIVVPPQLPPRWPGATNVALSQLFTQDAVFQRGTMIPVWGTADPNSGSVLVSLAGQSAVAPVDGQGHWRAYLPALPAGGPFILTVTGRDEQTTTSPDIMVGDVYVASGQSNMSYSMLDDPQNRTEAARANDPGLREFAGYASAALTPQYDFHDHSGWVTATDIVDKTNNWYAAGYYFGKVLRSRLHIPIGIVEAAVPATSGEEWISSSAFRANPVLAPDAAPTFDAANDGYGYPAATFNTMISPLAGYAARGILWYQGEGNSSPPGRGEHYGILLKVLIDDWRARWGWQIPFYLVQLHGMGPETPDPNTYSGLAFVREGQLEDALTMPGVSITSAIDLGDPAGDVHPPDKADVGYRLARLVLYGETGPLYAGSSVVGSAIRIRFSHTTDGLRARGRGLSGFAIAGADKNFVWARAVIVGDVVVVSSDRVKSPVAARYAWSDDPIGANLYNGLGLPASPFRTDNW